MSQVTWTQVREAYKALLEAQQTATPTLIRDVQRYRPGSVREAPVAWIGDMTENTTFDSGTRNREIITEIPIATRFKADVLSSSDEFDQLADALRERFTDSYNTIADTILELRKIDTAEITFDGTTSSDIYRGMLLTLVHRIWEERT